MVTLSSTVLSEYGLYEKSKRYLPNDDFDLND